MKVSAGPLDGRAAKRKEAAEEKKQEDKRRLQATEEEERAARRPQKKKKNPNAEKNQIIAIAVGVGFLCLVLLSFVFPVSTPPPTAKNTEAFSKKVVPLVRAYIVNHYSEYGKGKVTHRQIKQDIVDKGGLGLTYEQLGEEKYSLVIKNEAEAISKRCDGGKKPVACVGEEKQQ